LAGNPTPACGHTGCNTVEVGDLEGGNLLAIGERCDEELLAAIRVDDSEAFELLFERHSDFVYNFAFRRTGSWSAAEDVVGVVLLELWRQRHKVVVKHGSLRPWLCGVAANSIRQGSRSRERQHRAFGRVAPGEPVADVADAVTSRLDDERRMKELLGALEALPAQQRAVLTLFVWEELSYEEIAEALDVPIGTVRSRLSRARSHLSAIGHDVAKPEAGLRAMDRNGECA
jgi:RNA polymerase sigma factor (sigma-70 family)